MDKIQILKSKIRDFEQKREKIRDKSKKLFFELLKSSFPKTEFLDEDIYISGILTQNSTDVVIIVAIDSISGLRLSKKPGDDWYKIKPLAFEYTEKTDKKPIDYLELLRFRDQINDIAFTKAHRMRIN